MVVFVCQPVVSGLTLAEGFEQPVVEHLLAKTAVDERVLVGLVGLDAQKLDPFFTALSTKTSAVSSGPLPRRITSSNRSNISSNYSNKRTTSDDGIYVPHSMRSASRLLSSMLSFRPAPTREARCKNLPSRPNTLAASLLAPPQADQHTG